MKKIKRKKALFGLDDFAIMGLLGSLFSGAFSLGSSKVNADRDKDLAKLAYEQEKEQNEIAAQHEKNFNEQKSIIDRFNKLNENRTIDINEYKCGGKRVIKGKKNMYLS